MSGVMKHLRYVAIARRRMKIVRERDAVLSWYRTFLEGRVGFLDCAALHQTICFGKGTAKQ